jgi:hypothetical protein
MASQMPFGSSGHPARKQENKEGKMTTKTTMLATVMLAFSITPSVAQPVMVKKFNAWGVYSYGNTGKNTCYVLTVPQDMKPSSVDHGENFFLVAPASGAAGDYGPQAKFGYDLDQDQNVIARVGEKTFRMISRGNTAWTLKESREGELVSAMRDGSTLVVEARSARGTKTRYAYSLAGLTAALKRADRCD